MEHPQVAVQLVRHRLAVEVDAGREYDQLKPLGHLDNEQTLYSNSYIVKLTTERKKSTRGLL